MSSKLAEYQKQYENMVRQATDRMQEQVKQASAQMEKTMEQSLLQIKGMLDLEEEPKEEEPQAVLHEDGSMTMNATAVKLLLQSVDGIAAGFAAIQKEMEQ